MARLTGSDGRRTMAAIQQAALQLIYEHGYEATSLRLLAKKVGLHTGSLYNHISNKQELLFYLIRSHMEDLLRSCSEYMDAHASGDSRADVEHFIRFHIRFHVDRKHEVFISYSELRSLDKQNYEFITAMRQIYENRLISLVSAGIDKGAFHIGDARIVAFGVLSMLAAIPSWFKPDSPLTVDAVTEQFTAFVLNGLAGSTPPANSNP